MKRKTKKKQKRVYGITHEEFVRVWQKASCARDVADKFGISPNGASVRAHMLRLKGVPLKRFNNNATLSRQDIAKLAKLAKGLEK